MTQPEREAGRNGPSGMAEEAQDNAADLLDLLRRERADFLNYKRRVERERAGDRERARADVLQRLLPLLDEFDRALAHVPPDLQADAWVQGVMMGRQRMDALLGQLGVERIGAEGEPFDPALHEAVFYDTQPDASEPRVTAVIRAGYRMGDVLLRPAQVGVVGPPEQPEANATAAESNAKRSPDAA